MDGDGVGERDRFAGGQANDPRGAQPGTAELSRKRRTTPGRRDGDGGVIGVCSVCSVCRVCSGGVGDIDGDNGDSVGGPSGVEDVGGKLSNVGEQLVRI